MVNLQELGSIDIKKRSLKGNGEKILEKTKTHSLIQGQAGGSSTPGMQVNFINRSRH